MALRLLMMGTGQFAVPVFSSLYESPHVVVGLVTQPDRTGRGHHHHVNPMKEIAAVHSTPVLQPEKSAAPEFLERLREFSADLFVVAAYGQILSADLLAIPRLGAINVHASLLPKYRGAAPINYAILRGESATGVTIFQIEPRLDAGPMLAQVSTPIEAKETAGDLEERLSRLAVPPTQQVIAALEAGNCRPIVQDRSLVSTAPRMNKTMGAIDWRKSAAEIEHHVRAMQPWPKPFTFLHQSGAPPLRLLILDVDPAPLPQGEGAAATPGTVVAVDRTDVLVRTRDGAVALRRLQPAGKRAMTSADFLHGHHVRFGDRFGPDGG
jgi:methionyl-tRNA formyltransferase